MAELGYTCPCGKYHQASAWAAAHWYIRLKHTCDTCRRINDIKSGIVLKSKLPKEKKSEKRNSSETVTS